MDTALTVFDIATLVAAYSGGLFAILLFPVGSLYCKLRRVEDPPDWVWISAAIAFAIMALAVAVLLACALIVTGNAILQR